MAHHLRGQYTSSLVSSMAAPEIDNHTHTLQDSTKMDEEKFRAVEEIWNKLEVYTANTSYYVSLEKFMKAILGVLNETVPQFIAENGTQKLRIRCLELTLRMACHESVKNIGKEISKVMLRLVQIDNEKNAVLALKIICDVWKLNKIYFMPEITPAVTFLKNIVKDMNGHVNNHMFEVQDFTVFHGRAPPILDEGLIDTYLNHCFHTQPIAVSRGGMVDQRVEYTLIPRASVSLKVIVELNMFFVYIYQHHKQTMMNDCMDFLVICLDFISHQLPENYKASQVLPPKPRVTQTITKELMEDFHTAQSKMLSYITIMGKVQSFMEVLIKNSTNLTNSILAMLETLDEKAVATRREILVALKFCFTTELKNHLMRFLPRLLDEECMLGKGYTAKDNMSHIHTNTMDGSTLPSPRSDISLRTFLYQMLADLLHHIRYQLTFPLLLQASVIFCREMNDPSISFQTQVMCVRLLCSICECLHKLEQQGEATRDILWMILDNLSYKLERIATYDLPLLVRTHGLEDASGRKIINHEMLPKDPPPVEKKEGLDELSQRKTMDFTESQPEDGSGPSREPDPPLPPVAKAGKLSTPAQIYTDLGAIHSPMLTVTEARNFVKYLLHTVKTCVMNIKDTAKSKLSYNVEKEKEVMEGILRYGLICMDVYMLPFNAKNPEYRDQRTARPEQGRTKDEKESLDSFAHVFICMDSDVFREIFAKNMPMVIDRINSNPTVQLFANAFLVRADWVCKFGSIMIRYLMDNMDKLAVSNEKTALFVKLFKIIFSAIGAAQHITTEGELMLKPYLPDLIRKATEYALTAKEPLNYFLLLRALFRSIGGGAHDILYGQFLPLLPNLLQFLNKLQSCNHRLQMRELFLELCLTVPVRLSSLLPYLPLLMDPLVCALNGSVSLVQQGLRTLELCVDNLQPEYLFEHMAPVRSALIQGLWRVLSTSSDTTSAQTAFRILGKFGGANRRILNNPQMLTYINEFEYKQAVITVEFSRNIPGMQTIHAEISLSEIVSVAMEQMSLLCYRIPRMMMIQPDSTGNVASLLPHNLVNQQPPIHYQLVKESCMELAKGLLISSLCPDPRMNPEDWKQNVIENLKDSLKRLETAKPSNYLFKGAREHERKMYINALVVLMMGVIQKDLRSRYVNFYSGIIRQLTINALLESITQPEMLGDIYRPTLCLDGSILVDAIAIVLSDTNKDFLNSAIFALQQLNDTCDYCISDKNKLLQFPIIRYLFESVCSLCYGPAWFARLGGASGLSFIIQQYPVELLRNYLPTLVESLCEVIVGLTDEISSGAIDMAVSSLCRLHKRVFNNYDMVNDPNGWLDSVVRIYIPILFHTTSYVRDRIWELLRSLAELGPSLLDICQRNMDAINTTRNRIVSTLKCMSMTEQEASLSTINALLVTVPETVGLDFDNAAFQSFFETVFDLCENDVLTLLSRDYYKSMDTCPGHFLPPYPITTQMENLKAIAIKTLIISYKVLCKDGKQGHEEQKTEFASRVLTIAIQSALFGPEKIQTAAGEGLTNCAPIPKEKLMEVAGTIINSFDDPNNIDVENLLKMEKLISFNSELWNKDLAIKFVNHIDSWQTSATDGFPQRVLEDISAVQAVMRLILRANVLDFDMVNKLLNFIAFFELNYTTDTDFGWISSICELTAHFSVEIVNTFCTQKFLGTYAGFLCRILNHEAASEIRKVLKNDPTYFENLLKLHTLEDGKWTSFMAPDLESLIVYEESIMKLLEAVVVKETEWFENNHALLNQIRGIWTSPEFGNRYSINPGHMEENGRKLVRVQTFPASKLNTPHLLGKIFMKYLKKNPDNLDLLFDLMLAFDGCFATDFGYIREFLEVEIIPTRSIPWRLRAMEALLERLEKIQVPPQLPNQPPSPPYITNTIISRYIQYVILPCLVFVFERYPSADILGPGLPPDEDNVPDPNHCITRLTGIIDKHRNAFNEQNMIAMYQFCTLLVEYAPNHIHNNECKYFRKQGSRLRIFMVFVWTTLTGSATTANILDPTVRFTGYLFLAHLIDKFTINRKIVLQVFETLLKQYQLDNRELVRKAIDVVTPAVPVRLAEEGYTLLLTQVKKILMEESHNMPQIQHVIASVVRNYKVYFHVRQDLIQPLLASVQRALHTISGNVEGYTARKLALDVCEMAIKWDLLRNRLLEQQQSDRLAETVLEVDQVLEKLKVGEKEDREEDLKAMAANAMAHTIPKEHIDTIINILLKFACSLQYQSALNPNTPPQLIQATLELGRRALGLLRAALKPYVWGEIAEIKYAWLEKQLTIPQEVANPRPEPTHIHVYTQHIQTAQQTLETLLALSSSMSRNLLFRVMRSLQKPLLSCLMQTWAARNREVQTQTHTLVKTVNYMISKLFEKTETVGAGVQELETLNQYLIKYLNDHFTNYCKSQAGVVQQIFTPFSVLRSICSTQPCYLEGTCLPVFLKVLEKSVRDQVSTHPPADSNREKNYTTTIDFINVALELMKSRVGFFTSEHRRTLCQNILYPLIEKTPYDKVLLNLVSITHEVLITHTDRNASNPGLPLASRLHVQCERKIYNSRTTKDPNAHPLMAPYLAMALVIFNDPSFRNSEYAPRMSSGFYWGLMSSDPDTRRKFLAVWERTLEPYVLQRLMHILKDESWHHFRKYNWIRHVIWLLCQSCIHKPYGEFSPKKPIYFGDCTTLARTLEVIAGRDAIPSLGALDVNGTYPKEEPMDTGEMSNFDKLVAGQRGFLLDAMEYDTTIILNNIYNMMFNMADTKFTSKIFKRLFCSLWSYMLAPEKLDVQAAIVPFLTSGVHNSHSTGSGSVLTPWMEAVDQTGEIKLPPKLIHFISKNHFAWHKGLLLLERDCRFLECKYAQTAQPQIRQCLEQAYGESEHVAYRETLDYLAMLYKDLDELDAYAAIWDRRAIKQETVNALNHIQRGEIREAQKVTEDAITQMGDMVAANPGTLVPSPPLETEYNHLFEQYAVCCEELLEWEKVRDYANHNIVENPFLLMKAALHIPDWSMVKDCLDQLTGCIPAKNMSSYHQYYLMKQIMTPPKRDEMANPLQQQNTIPSLKTTIEKKIDETITQHVQWWRNLPSVISNSHVKVLQAASMLREVADCVDLRVALDASGPRDYNVEVINQMKHVIKVWSDKLRNRRCASSDELSMFSTVYDWRTQVHMMTLKRLEEWEGPEANVPHGTNTQNILPVHSIVQGQMIIAQAAKEQKNYDLAIDTMNKLHTISAVPAMDAHIKICEHLKLIRQQAERSSDPKQQQHFYQLGLQMLNSTDVSHFNPEQVSKIFAIRGQFLGGLDKREEAVKAFSYATQIIMEKQPTSIPTNAFKAWGDQQDKVLQKDQTELAAITAGAGALACFLEVARSTDSETRPNKYIGRLLWTTKQMIALGESASIRANDIIEKNERTTVSYNWLTWLPQLVNDVRHRPSSAFVKILSRICEDFPLQIFYNLRCVLPPAVMDSVVNEVCLKDIPISIEELEPWNQALIPLLKHAIALRQADCRLFHTFLSELNNMREFWAERQLRFALDVRNELTRCINHQNMHHLPAEFVLDQDCVTAIHSWKQDFHQCSSVNFLEESELRYLAGEIRPGVSEDVFIQELTTEIKAFFDGCPCPQGQIIRYLETVISICTRLTRRLSQLPKNIPLKLASPWLAEFTNRMACIEMPKDLFHVQKTIGGTSKYTSSQYTSMLARVDPFYSISIESGESMKRISMRSINGKSSTYYLKRQVKAKSGVLECKQFLEYMNDLLAKERETARRFLSTCSLVQLQAGYGCTLIETTASIIGENQIVSPKSPICHPYEILSKVLAPIGMQPDDAVFMFYEQIRGKIADVDTKQQQECQIRQDVLMEFGEDHFIGRNNLLNYTMSTYADPTQFYNFRKQIAKHMGVLNILEYLLHLTPPTLQEIFLSRNFGQYMVPTYAFQLPNYEIPRTVPFRLTHNFYNFLGFAADGDLRWSAESTITCMKYCKPETWLRPLLWDFVSQTANPATFVSPTKGQFEPENSQKEFVILVNRIVHDFQSRVKNYDQCDPVTGVRVDGVDILMRMASSNERIAMMDPSLYPWF